ncbi:DEAD/DEAH box helicase [Lactobacillus sp. ESL0791]|uniref:DEAD/DEAH box helicase n=1 Tax=Lactobacillus sp. ESL0791 TaxID=2983234 RepID=UPI0023F86F7F|nr:DEAD/DEAH box helicase [Lactobacillus sp. ESL0791]MDF7639300.1 DEAD/DEAH box helicase [Lactobacillus sp. ESL0791]
MTKLNPIERSKYINARYKEYLRSTFQFGNGELQTLFENELKKETLFKGPYVALTLPFQRGKSVKSLIKEGIVCKSFAKLDDVNFERPLYSHQEEAIRRIGAGHSAIVTTGTGSGKTECFLYPILNDLMNDVEGGNNEVGVRAVFLYPMNALVNDQIDRVRKILRNCPDITFGFFTGDTKETVPQNYREKYNKETSVSIPKNELVSREEIRQHPPHLLFTNYSMLEYLLIRPNDYEIFSPERLRNWKYVVLDEAHTYYGSLGIELSMLMRRFTALAEKKPRFIITSATLGKQGKSEQDIVDFARNLTSTHFDKRDIIFSKRVPLTQDSNISVDGADYIKLKKNSNNYTLVKEVCGRYDIKSGRNVSELLYQLLCHDVHVHKIYNLLKKEAKNFSDILENISDLSDKQLIALIDLINLAKKDGTGIFDLKYHSFVRPLSGAFVTLGVPQQLSLTKTNNIGKLKAFEVGNCRFCNAPYIIGKIQHNLNDQLDYLFQNKEVDIYENYGNNEFIRVDYFLMKNTINEDEVEKNSLEEYFLCARCGAIYHAANLNARKCECGNAYKRIVFKVVQSNKGDELETFNNINQCPYCGHKSHSGVVKSLNLGKDEGTALIAQTLYEAIDEGVYTPQHTGKLSLKLGDKKRPIKESEEKVKQFLAFSDSRQQASFAAVFFNSNHVRMLRKRLIWKIIEDQKYRSITVDELASYLTALIKNRNLFQNGLTAHKNAWITLLVDLLKVDGSYDGEGLGLYYFDLDLSEIMNQIDEADVKTEFGKYGLTKADLETLMHVVFDIFKVTPAIKYVKSTLTPDEKLEYLDFRRFDNYVMFNCAKAINGIRSFLPVKGKNMVVRYVQKVCKCDENEAKELLDVVFNNLAIEGGILKRDPTKNAYQIDASSYVIKNYMNNKYYRCSKCGRLTPYNVHNACVQDKCNGTLKKVDPDVVLAHNYYRNQYKTKKLRVS